MNRKRDDWKLVAGCMILLLISSDILARSTGPVNCNGGPLTGLPGGPLPPGDSLSANSSPSLPGGSGATTFSAPGAGCSSCSGGASAASSGYGPEVMADQIYRIWTPNERDANSSFSPGFFSHYDSQMQVFPVTGGLTLEFVNASAQQTFSFVDGIQGDSQDGVFHDLRNASAPKVELLNSSNALVTAPANATKLKLTHWTGFVEEFELIDLDPSPTVAAWAGRLSKRLDREGHALTVAYKTWTPAEISASPSRQWQINTVADAFGNSLTFSYDTAQHSGRWCVSSVVRNDGATVGFNYNTDNLTSVAFASGNSTTYAYSQDITDNTTVVTTTDVSNPKLTGVFKLANDYTAGYTTPPTLGYCIPGRALEQKNANGELAWKHVLPTDAAADMVMDITAGSAVVIYGNGKRQNVTSFTPSTGGGGGAFARISAAAAAPPPPFQGYTVVLDSFIYGANATQAQIDLQTVPSEVDAQGREKQYEYDADYNRTKVIYPADATYEQFAYNSFGLQTRIRSRTGNVQLKTYDAVGNLTSESSGLIETVGGDVQTAAYSQVIYDYYPSTHASYGLLQTKKDPLFSAAQPTLYRTDYEYNLDGQTTKVIAAAADTLAARPETVFTYNASGQVSSVTDPESRLTSYTYDALGRQTQVTYPDTSTQQTLYGASGTAQVGLVVKTKDRVNIVTNYTYDSSRRLVTTTVGAAIDSDILDSTPGTSITDVNLLNVTSYTYKPGSDSLKLSVTSNGAKTDYAYDEDNQVVQVTQYPRVGKTLTSTKTYLNNELLCDTDPYGRKKYYGYRASDGTLIRTVTCTVPSFTLADFTAVWNLTRSSAANALYVVHDAIRDNDGHLIQIIDGRGTETRFEYDSQGRETKKTEAWGTSIAAVTETVYNAGGNVTEVRAPRYFDSADTEGYQKAKETWTYNGRGQVATHTEASGSAIAATESFTYDLGGQQATHTDFAGKVWSTIDDTCCGKSTASKNPLGHGSIRNTDPAGRVVHTATVADVQDHVANMGSPIDAKTLAESTTLFDSLGRTKAATTWLVALGAVDPVSPPIAGLNSVPSANGLTTQYLYDNNLTDGVGLDSATGLSYTKMATTGSASVSLSTAITKLAAVEASGGAGITFSAAAPGRASVVINAQDEVSFSISDAAGRTVMSGQLDNYTGTANSLLTWSCQLHDTVTTITGYGACLESRSIDALGKVTRSLTDGAGRTIQSIDQLSKITAFTYDAGGNQLSVRDPNNVGQDVVYDALGRAGLTTDTATATTNSTYDKAGNRVAAIDGKSASTTYVFDARGRQKSQKDRNNGTTSFAYLATGQLQSLTDAETQTTSYTYDDAGGKLTEQYPDHTGGTPGQSTYGIVTFTNDAAGRVLRKQDQKGDTCTMNYDLAGRLASKNYRTLADSPSGTIADTDSFTYDKAGRMLTATSGRYVNVVTYTYDSAGRKKTEGLTISGQTYTTTTGYNAKGELTSYAYPDGTAIARTYTARGELYQLKQGTTTLNTRVYDNGGRMTSATNGNGTSETRAYNTDNTLASISFAGASIGNLTYGWDANKNKTSEAIAGTMSNYGFTVPVNGYDSEDRLVGFNRTSGLTQSWNLSLVGDWNSVTTNGTAQTRTHGPTHELLTAGGQNVSTDTKGNITLIPAALRPNSASLLSNWDFDNRLNTADVGNNGSVDVTYKFDAIGRRVFRDDGTTATVYVQAGQQTIADYTAGAAAASPTYRYVYASYIDEPVMRFKPSGSETLYYHRNQQYSVVALTNASAAIVERYAYSAYGVPTITNAAGTVLPVGAVNNRYMYTGREWDSVIAQYHYRARMYDANLGRFASRDPIGYDGGLNCYSNYFYGSSVDPSGTDSFPLVGDCQWRRTGGKWKPATKTEAGQVEGAISTWLKNKIKRNLPIKFVFDVRGHVASRVCKEDCCEKGGTALRYETKSETTLTLGVGVLYPLAPPFTLQIDGRLTLGSSLNVIKGGCNDLDEVETCAYLSGAIQMQLCGNGPGVSGCVKATVECSGTFCNRLGSSPDTGGGCRFKVDVEGCVGWWCSQQTVINQKIW